MAGEQVSESGAGRCAVADRLAPAVGRDWCDHVLLEWVAALAMQAINQSVNPSIDRSGRGWCDQDLLEWAAALA